MEEWLGQYTEALEVSKGIAKRCKLDCAASENEQMVKNLRIANAMVRDMREMVRWAETGYDSRQAYAENRIDAYTMDPYTLDAIMTQANSEYLIDDLIEPQKEAWFERGKENREEMKIKIAGALEGLTEQEKTAFTLYKAERVQLEKVAQAMNITASSVRVYVRRAEQKIQRNLAAGEFQCGFDLAM